MYQKLLKLALANKHTSISGVVFLVAKYGGRILALWFPHKKEVIDSTADAIEGFAVAYLGISSVDWSKSSSDLNELSAKVSDAIKSGDTTLLKKSDVPQVPPKP